MVEGRASPRGLRRLVALLLAAWRGAGRALSSPRRRRSRAPGQISAVARPAAAWAVTLSQNLTNSAVRGAWVRPTKRGASGIRRAQDTTSPRRPRTSRRRGSSSRWAGRVRAAGRTRASSCAGGPRPLRSRTSPNHHQPRRCSSTASPPIVQRCSRPHLPAGNSQVRFDWARRRPRDVPVQASTTGRVRGLYQRSGRHAHARARTRSTLPGAGHRRQRGARAAPLHPVRVLDTMPAERPKAFQRVTGGELPDPLAARRPSIDGRLTKPGSPSPAFATAGPKRARTGRSRSPSPRRELDARRHLQFGAAPKDGSRTSTGPPLQPDVDDRHGRRRTRRWSSPEPARGRR